MRIKSGTPMLFDGERLNVLAWSEKIGCYRVNFRDVILYCAPHVVENDARRVLRFQPFGGNHS